MIKLRFERPWENRPAWFVALWAVPYIAYSLLVLPLYVPGWLALALILPYKWLHERTRAAMWEHPFNPLTFWGWNLPTLLLYLLLIPLAWYSNSLSWCVAKLPFQQKPDPKGG